MEDALAEMLARAFPVATGEQLSHATERFRRIVDNERRRASRSKRDKIASHLRNAGHYAALDIVKALPDE